MIGSRITVVRRLVQWASLGLLLVPLLWPGNQIWFGTYISSAFLGVALTDPLAALEVALAGRSLWWPLLWSVLPLAAVALVAGRVFCAWVCPLNTVLELAGAVRQCSATKITNTWWPYRVLAMFLVVAATVGMPLFTIISPIGIISRSVVFGVGAEAAFIGALIAAEWLVGRKAWCRFVCPVGALYGIIGYKRGLVIEVDARRCSQCGKCDAACSMGVKAGGTGTLDRLGCTNCGDCIAACPDKAISLRWTRNRKGGAPDSESMGSIAR